MAGAGLTGFCCAHIICDLEQLFNPHKRQHEAGGRVHVPFRDTSHPLRTGPAVCAAINPRSLLRK